MKSVTIRPALGGGQVRELVHELELLCCGDPPAGHRAEHGLLQP
jgi:hypothetical protein